jgi:predicted GH43/DUF377 family glycosyl hydrolase
VLDISPDSDWENHAVFDPCVVRMDNGSLTMWYTTRGDKPSGIAIAVDRTGGGDDFNRLGVAPVLTRDTPSRSEPYPYQSITRPSVVRTAEGWRMWYSTAGSVTPAGEAWIGTATSQDGQRWRKQPGPVLAPTEVWERHALQCPNVRYDTTSGLYQLWYSGGELYEPDAIGFATSSDGIQWTRYEGNPIFGPSTGWENYKIGSFQVVREADWYYAFYNAFEGQPFVSRVGMARSRDGVTGWERHPANPILGPGAVCDWNAAMVYKPTALWDAGKGRWDIWFNASAILDGPERIGHAWSTGLW